MNRKYSWQKNQNPYADDINLEDTNLPTRAKQIMKRECIGSMGELRSAIKSQKYRMYRGIGDKMAEQIRICAGPNPNLGTTMERTFKQQTHPHKPKKRKGRSFFTGANITVREDDRLLVSVKMTNRVFWFLCAHHVYTLNDLERFMNKKKYQSDPAFGNRAYVECQTILKENGKQNSLKPSPYKPRPYPYTRVEIRIANRDFGRIHPCKSLQFYKLKCLSTWKFSYITQIALQRFQIYDQVELLDALCSRFFESQQDCQLRRCLILYAEHVMRMTQAIDQYVQYMKRHQGSFRYSFLVWRSHGYATRDILKKKEFTHVGLNVEQMARKSERQVRYITSNLFMHLCGNQGKVSKALLETFFANQEWNEILIYFADKDRNLLYLEEKKEYLRLNNPRQIP